MSGSLAVELIRNAVFTALLTVAPLLVTALVVGVLVSLVQAVTQIQEQTLTFIPKLLAVAAMLSFTLPWILSRLIEYLVGTLRSLPSLVN